jgi:energy-coupling factor transport system permease protein
MTAKTFDLPKSLVHRLDPFTKFLMVLCVSSLVIVFANLYLLVIVVLACAFVSVLASISAGQMWVYLRPFLYLIGLVVVVQAFFYPFAVGYPLVRVSSDSPFLSGTTLVSLDGIVYGVTLGLRFVALIVVSTIFSLTTNSRDFLLSARRFKVPFEIVFMVNVALRFIPDIRDKTSEVLLAQTARGLELQRGNALRRLKNLLPLLLPLLITYILAARNAAVVIETRAFRWKKERTYMRSLCFSKMDYFTIVLTLVLTVLCGLVFWQYGARLNIL